ncbi:DUF300 domain containing protein [Russula decolorans]
MYCPSDNTQAVDQSHFWSAGGPHLDAHRIGWVVAGICALATVIISAINVRHHCRIRVLYMPPVYAIISFFSYRFFRSYIYYSLIQIGALHPFAFLLLLIEYVASTSIGHSTEGALARKGKRPLPAPFCCWRFRPTKWSVMQYVVVRPALSIAGIICQSFNVLCDSSSYNVHFASLYLDTIDFISVSVALYGLILFYDLTKEELAGRRPLAKFLSIKLIVFFTFYQTFMFTAMEDRVIHGTEFWSSTNIADGLNALATCIEMIFFAAFMMWSFNWKEYQLKRGESHTSVWRPLWDSINLWDFAVEIGLAFTYFANRIRGRLNHPVPTERSFAKAFGVEGYAPLEGELRINIHATSYASRTSYDEDIRLTPYKASALDLSRVRSPEDVDAYKPEESTLAA